MQNPTSAVALAGALLALPVAAPVLAGEIDDAYLLLEVRTAVRQGWVPEAVPPRLVVLEDGRVFVGGTRSIAAGQLDKKEFKRLRKRVKKLQQRRDLGTSVSFGGATPRYRLRLFKGQRLDLVATGDPRQAPAALADVGRLMADLEAFNHPSLRPVRPDGYLVLAREEKLPGGCRGWNLGVALADVLAGPRRVPTEQVVGWPTGAVSSSVCAGKRLVSVNFRPLLPGERP